MTITNRPMRRRPHAAGLAAFVLALVTAISAGPIMAQGQGWPVRGKLMGGAKDAAGMDMKKSRDVSGIACASDSGFPRLCMIVDDESQGAQIVIVKDGEMIAGDYIRLISDVYTTRKGREKAAELDAEAVAYGEGAFYVTGSHGRPRNTDGGTSEADTRAAATRRVFRIAIPAGGVDPATGKLTRTPTVTASSELEKLLQSEASLSSAFDGALAKNGLTVEGLAVADKELHVGLRGPVLDDGRAIIFSVPLDRIFDGGQGKGKIRTIDLGRDKAGGVRGIRDLVAYKGGFLIIAGPMLDPPVEDYVIQTGDYSIYRYADGMTARLLDLDGYGVKVKPEALLPLDEQDGTLRALILFDGPDKGAGRMVRIPLK